ncbi:IS200/IS605 family transposase [Phormidium sp. FACHB-592]|uniref:IS200/IS605 family transposase n=1 Tax=Stenomitos frigidus AS-A4 TaxID=2933935 RepID=A0ABV0KP24_9CYAN|nr:IS200/IS605 family transposase [Phormidium sp. FACHB-592]MBD2073344.1 IS200/IS605 family transposase [Phormidium sp. FACHB-592]
MPTNRYIARSRGVSRLYAHLVLTTKFRLKVIPPAMLQRLQAIMADLCTKWQCELLECNGEADHLHLVFRYAPQLQLSKFIDNVKSVSSRRVRQEFEVQLREAYWDWEKGFWNESYSIDSCGDAPLAVLRKYVQNQGY